MLTGSTAGTNEEPQDFFQDIAMARSQSAGMQANVFGEKRKELLEKAKRGVRQYEIGSFERHVEDKFNKRLYGRLAAPRSYHETHIITLEIALTEPGDAQARKCFLLQFATLYLEYCKFKMKPSDALSLLKAAMNGPNDAQTINYIVDKIVPFLKEIDVLTFHNDMLSLSRAASLAKAILKSDIQNLRLCIPTRFDSEGWSLLAAVIERSMRSLTRMDICISAPPQSYGLNKDANLQLAEVLSVLVDCPSARSNLRELRLVGNAWTKEKWSTTKKLFAVLLSPSSQLYDLELINFGIENENEIFDALGKNRTLRRLLLSSFLETDSCLNAMLQVLDRNTSLHDVGLSSDRISEAFADESDGLILDESNGLIVEASTDDSNGNEEERRYIQQIVYLQFLNQVGRSRARDPDTTTAEIVTMISRNFLEVDPDSSILIAGHRDDSQGLGRVAILYGLLRENPSNWCVSADKM